MKKVLLRFYNNNNLGDDLFVKIITQRYMNLFAIVAPKRNVTFSRINNIIIYKNRAVHLFVRILGKAIGKNNLFLALLQYKYDLMVYVGGSIFIEGTNIDMWRKERHFYDSLSIPYYILGSNFGPYQTSDFIEITSDILSKADDTCFRDQTSYHLFEDINKTRVSTDMAFSLNTSHYVATSEKIAIFSIIDCDNRFDKKTTEKYEQEMINMTQQLVKEDFRVVYMSFCKYEGDEAAIQRITDNLDEKDAKQVEIFNYDGNLEEALALMAKSEIIVAGRFHAAILGLLFSKKIVPMAYSDKTINILKDIKFTGEVIDIRKIDEFDGNKFDFNAIPITNVSKQIKLAETQFQELDKVLVRRK